jgi:hypothetical protein
MIELEKDVEVGVTNSKELSWHLPGGTKYCLMFIMGYLTMLSVSRLYSIG